MNDEEYKADFPIVGFMRLLLHVAENYLAAAYGKKKFDEAWERRICKNLWKESFAFSDLAFILSTFVCYWDKWKFEAYLGGEMKGSHDGKVRDALEDFRLDKCAMQKTYYYIKKTLEVAILGNDKVMEEFCDLWEERVELKEKPGGKNRVPAVVMVDAGHDDE